MKDKDKKLILFEIIIMIISIFSSFIIKILSGYKMVIFMVTILFVFSKLLGFEKNKKDNMKNHIIELIVFILTFLVVYSLFGILVGFTKQTNNILSLVLFTILPIVLYVSIREILRFSIIKKTDKNKILTIISILFFIVLDLSNFSYVLWRQNPYSVSYQLLLLLFPIVSSNIVYSNLTKKSGYIPVLVFAIFMNIYHYIFPVMPNITVVAIAFIDTLLPILLWVRMNSFYDRVKKKEKNLKDNYLNISILLVPLIFISLMIYFSSGFYRFEMVAVGTNNLKPDINRGDIVFIDKYNNNPGDIDVGEVIAYRENNIIMINRVMKKDGYICYVEENKQPKQVNRDDIVGTIHFKLKYLGLPSLWFNNS